MVRLEPAAFAIIRKGMLAFLFVKNWGTDKRRVDMTAKAEEKLRQSAEICMFYAGTQCPNPRSEGSYLCEVHMHMSPAATDMDRDVFRVVNDRYMQDVREFFARSNFYLVAEGGLLSVFFARNVPDITSNLLNWGVIAIGLFLALLWWLVAWGAAYWIRRWRQEVWQLDTSLNRFRSITNVEGTFTCRRWSQPEYVTKFLPIVFSVVWIVLAVVLLMV